MDQTQSPRYVSRFEHLALHPRLHREGFLIHYLPPREPPTRRICYKTRSTKLLSQTQPHNRGVGPQPNNNQSTSHFEGYKPTPTPPHQEGVNHNLNLYQRGRKPTTQSTSTSTKEGATQEIKGLQQMVCLNHKPLPFSTKQDPNRIGQKISSSVEKTSVLIKENLLGKIPNEYGNFSSKNNSQNLISLK